MIQSTKIYSVDSDTPISRFYDEVSQYTLTETESINGEEHELRSRIKNVKWLEENNIFTATLEYEELQALPQLDDKIRFFPVGRKIDFAFMVGSSYYIPFAKYSIAEISANKINKILFKNAPRIIRKFITHDMIERFIEQNPCDIKWCHWDELDIPGVDKARLGGTDVRRSSNHDRFEEHGGLKRFIMLTLFANGWTIALSHGGSVVFYSYVTRQEILDFIRNKIFPLF